MFAFALAGCQWLILLFPIWQHCGENAGQSPFLWEKAPGLTARRETAGFTFYQNPRRLTDSPQAHTYTWAATHLHTLINQYAGYLTIGVIVTYYLH